MNVQAAINQAIGYFRTGILLLILIAIATHLVRSLGVTIPLRVPEPTVLAYIAGAYWLSK